MRLKMDEQTQNAKAITVESISYELFREKTINEDGLVLFGAGGSEIEWITGVTEILFNDGIAKNNDPNLVWGKFYKLTTTGGRTDIVLMFPGNTETLKIGKLAMWRLIFGNASWVSDYHVNYASHHGFVSDESFEDIDKNQDDEEDYDEEEE